MDGYYAFMLVATALVLMMTVPGLALFYGGMSRSKSVLNMMMMSLHRARRSSASSTCCGAGRWASAGDGVGSLLRRPVRPLRRSTASPPGQLHRRVMFQLTFAVITVALISRRDRRPREVLGLDRVRAALGHAVLLPDRPHGVERTGDSAASARPPRRTGLRRRHGGAHQRRYRRPGARADHRQAHRLRQGADAAAQPDADHDRRRPAVVRLVRLQRRLDRLRRAPTTATCTAQFMSETGCTFAQHHARHDAPPCSAGC